MAWVTFTLSAGACHVSHPVRVGSKQFTESVILGQLATQLAKTRSAHVVHTSRTGGTRVLWQALVSREIDFYPEYTGTLVQEIFSGRQVLDEKDLARLLAEKGIGLQRIAGVRRFLCAGMKESVARQLDIRSISDLRRHPALRFGFSNEFIDRHDGWASLRLFYQLPPEGCDRPGTSAGLRGSGQRRDRGDGPLLYGRGYPVLPCAGSGGRRRASSPNTRPYSSSG